MGNIAPRLQAEHPHCLRPLGIAEGLPFSLLLSIFISLKGTGAPS